MTGIIAYELSILGTCVGHTSYNAIKQQETTSDVQQVTKKFYLESKVNVSLASNNTCCQYTFDENFNGLKRGLYEIDLILLCEK